MADVKSVIAACRRSDGFAPGIIYREYQAMELDSLTVLVLVTYIRNVRYPWSAGPT